jgi:hypothetical protein
MNRIGRLATSSMIAVLLSSPGAIFAQYAAQPGPPPPGYGGPAGWDAPPSEFNEVQRKGFQDGMVGARKDYENHRAPNVNNRDEYRHPNVQKGLREDYRMGFQRGYDLEVRHMMDGGPGPR